ncbi:hypothetical protein [Metabacillus niabensis]|uniref:Phosphoglycerol transferase MdoB-like AlkP superfamily enzyme n=1 Tax=Metabacillus niabensis TaxID=324854 RepID=A0ABT9Z2A6_9BACI|nr:hypothetical protein [Metabacillus niabensis]MDQ0226393.1 phosphoglycerol transferase MdoB-like AlkP superfamily enzyme [Metabacillus niabensis]
MKIFKMIKAFLFSLCIPVLSVLYIGLIVSAIVSILAGILRTVGYEQIKLSIWKGIELPVTFSLPFSFTVSFLLIYLSIFIKRSINYLVTNVRI